MVVYYADLHVHSKYSRATSRQCDLEHLALWARKKGLAVLGTGDFTHPGWMDELESKLEPAEPGLFRLRSDLERALEDALPAACRQPTRFMLSVEVGTRYVSRGRMRRVHHLVYAPCFDHARRIAAALAPLGDLAAEGRPMVELGSRQLLDVVLSSGSDCFLIPAHIWMPQFAALGAGSGFDSIEECYGDLASHIFAVETGLASDPWMNWRVSSLDEFRLVSNSDAHAPDQLGREACRFEGEFDYFGIRRALRDGDGYGGTVEFFPESGPYHLDGHRACGVRMTPEETRAHAGRCPQCDLPVTTGVLHRVAQLADRDDGQRPGTAGAVRSLVPLMEILAETSAAERGSSVVREQYDALLSTLGPELSVLCDVPLDEIRAVVPPVVAEAIARMRACRVRTEPGYDGESGRVRLFDREELLSGRGLAAPAARPDATGRSDTSALRAPQQLACNTAVDWRAGLDASQRRAAEFRAGPCVIVAGPGAGKSHALVRRIAALCEDGAVPATVLLVVSSLRIGEAHRCHLQRLLPDAADGVTITTFALLAYSILREQRAAAGLPRGFRLAHQRERAGWIAQGLGVTLGRAAQLMRGVAAAARHGDGIDPELHSARRCEDAALAVHGAVRGEELVGRAADLLTADRGLRSHYRARYRWISVDDYQDVQPAEHRLLSRLVGEDGNLCVAGDPDQAIFGSRGAEIGYFLRFCEAYPGAQSLPLRDNYRSTPTLSAASTQVIVGSAVSAGSPTDAADPGPRVVIHEAPTELEEVRCIVREIGLAVDGTMGSRALSAHPDAAVLVRTPAQGRRVGEALRRAGIPHRVHSDALLVDDPRVAALLRAMREAPPRFSVVERLEWAAERDDLAAAILRPPERDWLRGRALVCEDDFDRYAAEISMATQADTWDRHAQGVSVITLHAAVGMEFTIVFLCGWEESATVGREAAPPRGDGEEARRLFYFGMTRAKRVLHVSYVKCPRANGRGTPTRFLRSIAESLLDRRAEGGGDAVDNRGAEPLGEGVS